MEYYKENQTLEVDDIHVIMTNYQFTKLEPLLPALDQLSKSGIKRVVLVARAFTSDCIKECLESGVFPINAPYVNQKEIMKDLQVVIGGTYFHDEGVGDLESMNISDLDLQREL